MYAFISAAADVDLGKLRLLIAQGVSPSSIDYDKRTALMVAAHEGNEVRRGIECALCFCALYLC